MHSTVLVWWPLIVLLLIAASRASAPENRSTSNERNSYDSDNDDDDEDGSQSHISAVSDDIDCNARWIQRLNESGYWANNYVRHFTELPPTILDIVDACYVRALQKANIEKLASVGYYTGVWKALERTHYNELATHELQLPSPYGADYGLRVTITSLTLKDIVLDDRNGLSTTDFDVDLSWHDSRLDAARLQPPFDAMGRRGAFAEDSIVIASIFKPQVDLNASPHNKHATATYIRLLIHTDSPTLVSATLAFDEFRSDCNFVEKSNFDLASCTLHVVFKPVWLVGRHNLSFATRNWKPQHVTVLSRKAHPRVWIVSGATFRATSGHGGFLVSVNLSRERATPQTIATTRTTSTPVRETWTTTIDGEVENDVEDNTESVADASLSNITLTAPHDGTFVDEKPPEGTSVSCWFYPAAVVSALAPFAGKEMAWKFGLKLPAILLLQPGFIVRSFGVVLPAAYEFLLYFTLVSMIVDIIFLHCLQSLQAGVYRLPPSNRILLVALALVRKFGSIAGFPLAALPLPEFPTRPIPGQEAGGEAPAASAAAVNYANSWVVVGVAAYVCWLGLATAIYLCIVVAYLAG